MDNQFFLNTGMPPIDQPTMPTGHTLSAMETQSSDHDFPAPATQPSGYFFQQVVCNSGVSNQCFAIRELIGNLGNVCNSGEISASENHPLTGNTLSLNTPITENFTTHHANSIPISPFGSNLPSMPGDPGFSERATRLSYFGSRSFNGRTGNFVCPNTSDFPSNSTTLIASGKLHRVSSSPSVNGSPIAENRNLESSTDLEYTHPDGETGSRPFNVGSSSSRKRKSSPNGKCNEIPRPSSAKVVESGENSNAKRSKLSEDSNGNKTEQKMEEEEKDDDEIKKQNVNITSQNPPEPSKDYIHVRARRGQATDSHSLAERVRREKIGERMKLLQDLVPGCNKVTGKALMLEEIINYVQSLQRQVEFLSMKVACVNPRLDFNTDNLFPKDIYQPNCSIQTQPTYPLDALAPSLYGANSLQQNGITSSGMGPPCLNPTDPINQTRDLQLPTLDVLNNGVFKSCEGDLHTIVQMGFGQSNKVLQDNTFQPQFLQGSNQTSSMKIEF